MKCPNCGVQAPAGATECPGCGVIFAKFKRKLENLEPSSVPAINPWIGRGLAAALLLAWIIAFTLYYRQAVSVMKVHNPGGPARAR